MRVTFLGNFDVSYSSENHHKLSLEALGHEVIALQETKVFGDQVLQEAQRSQMFVWVHTHNWHTPGMPMNEVLQRLRDDKIPSVTYHLDLWLGLRRQMDMQKDDYWHIQHFFTADKNMAEWLNENTLVKGHYLEAGVYHEECYIEKSGNVPPHELAFVGSKGYHPEWPYRPQLVDWLQETYKNSFAHYGGDGRGTVRGKKLNWLYADTRVIVGDSLCLGFKYPHYWSDRVYETMGRGGFLIMPRIPGLPDQFKDRQHIVFYDFCNFAQLKDLIDYYLNTDDEREGIRHAGHEEVKAKHTYKHRWQTIIDEVIK